MIDFLLKSSISLLLILLFYHLVLEKEKMHRFNRFYLLLGIAFSFTLPFITIEIITETVAPIQQTYTYVAQENLKVTEIKETIDYKPIIFWSLYGLVTSILIFRYIRNILKIVSNIKSNQIVEYKNAKLVLLEGQTPPHTFLNYIFLNREDYQNVSINEELYTHELIHVNQKHTLDVLLIETVKTIFWFNPIFIFYKKAIQLNHEFLADEKVVKAYNDIPFYQSLLLAHASTNPTLELTSNLNYSVTKKRFMMMTKTVSRTKTLLYKIALLPLFSGLVFFTCVESIAQKSTYKSAKNVEVTYDLIHQFFSITKTSTDQEINSEMQFFKDRFKSDVVFSDIKRNSKNEIIAVKVKISSPNGAKNTFAYADKLPIEQFHIFSAKLKNNEVIVGLYNGNLKSNKWKQTVYYTIPPPPPPKAVKSSNVAPPPPPRVKKSGNIAPPPPPKVAQVKFKSPIIAQEVYSTEKIPVSGKALLIIDGKKADPEININNIDPKSIESMSVLKGIDAIEKYGEDAKYGVIELTTKSLDSSKSIKK